MNISMNMPPFLREWKRRAVSFWKTFLLRPAQYWKNTLLIYVVLLLVLLSVDVLIFWQFAQTIHPDEFTGTPDAIVLEHQTLDAMVLLLEEREQLFQQNPTLSVDTVREVFPVDSVGRE